MAASPRVGVRREGRNAVENGLQQECPCAGSRSASVSPSRASQRPRADGLACPSASVVVGGSGAASSAARSCPSSSARCRAIFARSNANSTSACWIFSCQSTCNCLSFSRSSRKAASCGHRQFGRGGFGGLRRGVANLLFQAFIQLADLTILGRDDFVGCPHDFFDFQPLGALRLVIAVDIRLQRGEDAPFLRLPVEPARLSGLRGRLGGRRSAVGNLLLKLGVLLLQPAKLLFDKGLACSSRACWAARSSAARSRLAQSAARNR